MAAIEARFTVDARQYAAVAHRIALRWIVVVARHSNISLEVAPVGRRRAPRQRRARSAVEACKEQSKATVEIGVAGQRHTKERAAVILLAVVANVVARREQHRFVPHVAVVNQRTPTGKATREGGFFINIKYLLPRNSFHRWIVRVNDIVRTARPRDVFTLIETKLHSGLQQRSETRVIDNRERGN